MTIRPIEWKNAKNISSSYGGYKATIITYSFQKDKVKIARQYGYFTQGLSVWSWGIDKKAQYVNISFFVKKKDYEKVVNNSPNYHNLWFSDRKYISTLPFFGLRNINLVPNTILLFFDLWKYNYSIMIGIPIFFMPTLLMTIYKGNMSIKYNIKNKYLLTISLIFLLILFLRFLI